MKTDKRGSALVGKAIASLLIDAVAAFMLMYGLHGFRISVSFVSCLLVCIAARLVIRNGAH